MPKPTGIQGITKDTEQYILNKSFDPDFEVLAVELLTYDGATDTLKRALVDSIENTMILDQTDPNNIYQAWATPGTATSEAKWKIRRIATVGGVKTIAYAGGSTSFTNIFDNRASLSYS